MAVYTTSFAALVLAALSLGPSFAHVLESLPRLTVWRPELWREATVFNGQFILFARIGAPLDVGAIIVTGLLAYLLFDERPAFWFALSGAVLLMLGLVAWFSLVAPANSILATWKPGPLPANFNDVRLRWETGHMVVAGFKLVGFVSICLAVLKRG
jgi:hypothetical protein